ncbi:hypothetical protein [Pararhizobium sp. O133]|uniref:hypothetical protein n=1 Tax=Pararhizobium sp. O133 TaxID=3449278 RepID=UPI003F684F19
MNILADVGTLRAPVNAGAQLYIDSPMPNALDQVLPFFKNGFFPAETMPVMMRRRSRRDNAVPDNGAAGPKIYKNTLRNIASQQNASAGIVYYAFNAQMNATLVSNRSLRHVLALHGESNKISSFRPAARLYDYVLVAGDLACRRYLQAGIFTRREVELGRLIRLGDSVVQSMPYFAAAPIDSDGWLLYAPTWETSNPGENYSSAEGGFGFELLRESARQMGLRNIMVKPHPNFGMRDTQYLRHLVSALRRMSAEGYTVRVLDDGLNWRVRLALRLACTASVIAPADTVYPVSFALVDISGMEAICLKQGIAHMVIQKPTNTMPDDAVLVDLYRQKSFTFGEPGPTSKSRIANYVAHIASIDARHRNVIFSYSDESLVEAAPSFRYNWLDSYIRKDPYWSEESY